MHFVEVVIIDYVRFVTIPFPSEGRRKEKENVLIVERDLYVLKLWKN